MSFIVTPRVRQRRRAASAARSTVSWSGCLPNFVILMPEDPESSPWPCASAFRGSKAEADGLGAVSRRFRRVRGKPHLHPERARARGRASMLIDVAAHAGAAAVDHRPATNGTGMPGAANGDDRERPQLALGRDVDRAELGAEARPRRRCGGRRTSRHTTCTRGRPGADRRRAPGNRPAGICPDMPRSCPRRTHPPQTARSETPSVRARRRRTGGRRR